ncbi:hypothetical protein, partial [Streptomyces mirabilis]
MRKRESQPPALCAAACSSASWHRRSCSWRSRSSARASACCSGLGLLLGLGCYGLVLAVLAQVRVRLALAPV